MKLAYFLRTSIILLFTLAACCDKQLKWPTVLIGILVRNKAHTLPYFLTFLERLNYPKNRIQLWIYSDNNVDKSIEILSTWLDTKGKQYHRIEQIFDANSSGFKDENGIADWSAQRFQHVINLREKALNKGRDTWVDFIWMLDADVFLTNPNTLNDLVSKNVTVVAPLLKSDGLYSNFWAGITKEYYYLRTDEYGSILHREKMGCFNVPMVHSAVLIDLRTYASDKLTYNPRNLHNYDGPIDDIITFAVGANKSGIPLFICNDNEYGFIMVPLEKDETIKEDLQRLTNTKVEILTDNNELLLAESLEQFVKYPVADNLKADNIYMINLLRRPERRNRMHRLFKELGIRAETIDAVDGRTLNESFLKDWGIEMMQEYVDPYHERPMTMGEIGCFLSHYIIWDKVIEDGLESVIVLEDDLRFEPFFRQKINYIFAELENLPFDWDLVYLGRKKLVENDEAWVEGSKYLVHAGYSYWTLGYILSINGARKLIEAGPLTKLIPVDEYLPILSDVHPRNDWKKYFSKRDMTILSVNPLLIYPIHYTGEKGYISDTENSTIIFGDENANDVNKREEL